MIFYPIIGLSFFQYHEAFPVSYLRPSFNTAVSGFVGLNLLIGIGIRL